jgi:hypothetical protein
MSFFVDLKALLPQDLPGCLVNAKQLESFIETKQLQYQISTMNFNHK